MQPVVADVARSGVCVFVCLFVCVFVLGIHTGELCKNGWTDRDLVWRLTHVGPRNHVLNRGRSRSDESIRREGWQDGDAAFYQITFDTCFICQRTYKHTDRQTGLLTMQRYASANCVWLLTDHFLFIILLFFNFHSMAISYIISILKYLVCRVLIHFRDHFSVLKRLL